MSQIIFDELMDAEFLFQDRGTQIPATRRPAWRITLIALALKVASRASSSSLQRLHILDWAVRSSEGKHRLGEFILNGTTATTAPIRYDPAVVRALQFGAAEGLFAVEKGTIQLTAKGNNLAEEVISDGKSLVSEIAFLKTIKKSFSEKASERFVKLEALI